MPIPRWRRWRAREAGRRFESGRIRGFSGRLMTARIIDGKARAERATAAIKVQIAARVAAGKPPPGLAVVLVGEHPPSQIYVRNKRSMTQAVGMKSFEVDLPETVSQHELLKLIARLNA